VSANVLSGELALGCGKGCCQRTTEMLAHATIPAQVRPTRKSWTRSSPLTTRPSNSTRKCANAYIGLGDALLKHAPKRNAKAKAKRLAESLPPSKPPTGPAPPRRSVCAPGDGASILPQTDQGVCHVHQALAPHGEPNAPGAPGPAPPEAGVPAPPRTPGGSLSFVRRHGPALERGHAGRGAGRWSIPAFRVPHGGDRAGAGLWSGPRHRP